MSISPDYSNIQPYKEDDVNDAILRMLANPVFQVMIDYLYPPEIQDKIRADLSKAKSSLEFQKIFMYTGLNSILEKTTPSGTWKTLTGLSASSLCMKPTQIGLAALDPVSPFPRDLSSS